MSKYFKYILLIVSLVIVALIGCIIYRMFFQFDMNEIKIYAREEADKYKDKASVYTIIMEGVEHVLSSHNLTQQVIRFSRSTNTDVEQELVNMAINQCVANKYLPSKP